MEHDGPPELEAGADASHIIGTSCTQLFVEQGLHVLRENAARRQLVAIPRFGQKRFASKPLAGLLDRFFER